MKPIKLICMKSKSALNNYVKSVFIILAIYSFADINAQVLESLNRGLIAVNMGEGKNYIGWRLLGNEPDTIAFNLYRISDGMEVVKVNGSPLKGATNLIDTAVVSTTVYRYFLKSLDGSNELTSSDTVEVWAQNYLSVPIDQPNGGVTPLSESYTYTANDMSIGDLDGDGEYELILKWDPTNSKDNSLSGYTGNVYLDAYEFDGTRLWRIDLGINIRAGAHYTQFMVYDLDSDGKAEVACKTAPGTVDGMGNYLSSGPADSAKHDADYRNSSGYILSGPEYLTVFNGQDGSEITTVEYAPLRGTVSDWGDSYGNRVDRFLAAIAYLDGSTPSLVMCRGYYTRTVLVAWDLVNGELVKRWTFDTDNGYPSYAGQGNHGISVADVDEDGFDEIIYGAMAVDHDGSGLWNTNLLHGDAMHVADIIPERKGLERWGIHEGNGPGSALLDARTGEILWQTANGDVGRGVAADLTPDSYGMECWGGTDGLRNGYNEKVGEYPSSQNHVVWWDGDLSRELLNGINITKYGGGTLLTATNCSSNNSTKSNPSLQADIFGDWREEVIWRTSDNTSLRIYTTTDITSYRIKTLMHDHVYRLGIAWQNVAYNQPPHTGFYLGNGMFFPDSLRAPAKPRNLTLTNSKTNIRLNWSANYDSDLEYYFIYRSESLDEEYVIIDSVPSGIITFADTSVILDVQYFYKITALDTLGNESIPSDYVSGAATLRPDCPTGLKASLASTKVFLYWDKHPSEDVVGYNIYRSVTPGSNFVQLNTESIIEYENYTDEGLTDEVEYYYVVTAIDKENRESFYSDELKAIPGAVSVYQAEDAEILNATIETEHTGFNGTGYVNMSTTGSYIDFNYVYVDEAANYNLYYRYALGNTSRIGNLVVNDTIYNLTMDGTDDWTTYKEDVITVALNEGFNNTISFVTTGNDFGNLDQIRIGEKIMIDDVSEISQSDVGNIVYAKVFPNPFSSIITMSLFAREPVNTSVEIVNMLGQKVADVVSHKIVKDKLTVSWDGTNIKGDKLSSGIYFCKILANNEVVQITKIVLLD